MNRACLADDIFNFVHTCLPIGVTAISFFLIKRLLGHFFAFLSKRYGGGRVLIVGNCVEAAASFAREIAHNGRRGISLIGSLGCNISDKADCKNLGDISELDKILDTHAPNYVVFALSSYDKNKIIGLVNLCDDRCVKVYFLPVIYGYFRSAKQVERFGSTPLINIHSTPLDLPINAFMKRLVDILGAIILIVLTAPIMLVAAIGVKSSSKGPIIFKQVRVGKMGREFMMLKFRSMSQSHGELNIWSTGTDERKTKFGNFLRKTAIDELPQLFNVLAGSMSLVGPRPEIPHFVNRFKEEIPLYMVKHYVKPGITGLAQINGLRGDTSIRDRIHADIHYIENWSLFLDIAILLKTPLKMINKREVYGKPSEKNRS